MLDQTQLRSFHDSTKNNTIPGYTADMLGMINRLWLDKRRDLLDDMKKMVADLQEQVNVMEQHPNYIPHHFFNVQRRAIDIDANIERLRLLYELAQPAAEILKLHTEPTK